MPATIHWVVVVLEIISRERSILKINRLSISERRVAHHEERGSSSITDHSEGASGVLGSNTISVASGIDSTVLQRGTTVHSNEWSQILKSNGNSSSCRGAVDSGMHHKWQIVSMWIFTIIVFVKSDLLFASYFKIEQKQLGTYFQSSQIDRNRKLIKWVSFVNLWLYVEQKHRVQAREGRLFSYSLLFIKNSQLWKENQMNKLWSVQWFRESNGCSWLL